MSHDFKYGIVNCFVKCLCNCTDHDRFLAVVRTISVTSAFENQNVPMTYILKGELSEPPLYELLSLSQLTTVVFKMQINNSLLIAVPLNDNELE